MESEQKSENFELLDKTKSDEIKTSNRLNGGQVLHQQDKENEAPNKENAENNIRRHDEPSELSFEICKKKFCCCFIEIDDFINIFMNCCVFSSRKPRRKGEKTID